MVLRIKENEAFPGRGRWIRDRQQCWKWNALVCRITSRALGDKAERMSSRCGGAHAQWFMRDKSRMLWFEEAPLV